MSGAATSYEESVGSCGPPSPHTPPARAAPRGASVRRQLDFTGGAGDLEEDEDDDFLCRVADDIERGYSEAKLRAPPCVCGRGDKCAVERDDQSGRWKYVCPSRPKCNHVAFCEEVDLDSEALPTSTSHPKPSNPCAFNDPSNHMPGPRTPVNASHQVTGVITPVNVCPQVAVATTLFRDNPQGAGMTTLVNCSPRGEGTASPAKFIPQGVVATTPAKVSPQGQGAGERTASQAKFIPQGVLATTPAKVSPQVPVCLCTAGNCRKKRIGGQDWYVCHVLKGKGACSYKVLVSDFEEGMVPSAQTTPCNEVHPESLTMLHRPTAAVNTPSKSPMGPYGTSTPVSPNLQFHGTLRHGIRDCPKPHSQAA